MKKRRHDETPSDDRGDAEPFVRRWMRRKADAARNPEHEPPARTEPEQSPLPDVQPDASDEAGAAATDDIAEEEAKGDEDMPPLESIDEGGSVADFFSPRVSQELRRAALRRLFGQSQLPVVDELDDYAGDYTKFTRMGGLVTNEMKHRLEVAAQRLARRADEQLAAADPEPVARPEEGALAGNGDPEVPLKDADETDDHEDSRHDRNSD
ncbi:MAG: DUF3306 domain-containing protein [Candidatus Wenzhouxiangella sp. M2_3B_020]